MQKYEPPTVTRESDKFQLRMPDGMRQKIADQAKLNGRSINAEMVDRLRLSFDNGNSAESLLLARQNGLISFLCQCVDQLSQIPPASVEGQCKVDMVLALYKSMLSGEKVNFE